MKLPSEVFFRIDENILGASRCTTASREEIFFFIFSTLRWVKFMR